MPSLSKCLHLIRFLWCICWVLSTGVARAENVDLVSDYYKDPALDSRAKNQLLSPLTIDERYLHNEIPAENSQGTITLRGAVTEASAHNKEVQEAQLQVSRFKGSLLQTGAR